MASRKRNDFLDIVSDDEEGSDRGYDSEAAEESKGRSSKRRKVDTIDNSDEEVEDFSDEEERKTSNENDGDDDEEVEEEDSHSLRDEDDEREEEEGTMWTAEEKAGSKNKKEANKPVKPTKKNKTGVIYLSSLPPYLKPFALKSLIEARGFEPITRVFLTPAVPSASAPKRRSSNKRKTYTDGWVEFQSKKTAKICAETLNASIVGGRKGGWYHDDVWNMKYLKGFKWADLMEQVQRERSEREAKRRIEDARARREEKVFLAGVEKGKALAGMIKKNEEKMKKRAQQETGGGASDQAPDEMARVRRLFRQNEAMRRKDANDESALGEDTRRLLGKIF
ncbi:hypothetical protein ASPZODRAFT_127293 [Penicilliopsis zonata CBS 506.65]|uniref:Pre-rRNA-processing protein ESF2 n=1 Tax=Penicilliopsis zonata CBS 506.65 TaxID=1073090 RepID=A0A1L9SVQ3_9EURO|nr:hypothetical protein ASPZODRAFT_127293 [Penicilliopsis zonata CBS 506.65]OJJ51256.1 hypothetical protein ASPZODRAFT_127293 [Penicilliopsis zonata CBS 506.65]